MATTIRAGTKMTERSIARAPNRGPGAARLYGPVRGKSSAFGSRLWPETGSGSLGGIRQRLRKGGVDEQALVDVLDTEPGGDGQGDHRDELGGPAPDDRTAEDHAGGGIGDDLHETAGVVLDEGLGVVEVAVNTAVVAHGVLGDLAALHGRDRRQRQLPGQVAGGVDPGHGRLAVVVDHDVAVALI